MGGPSRSSIELALLMLVPGRLGGPLLALPFETVRCIKGGAPSPIVAGGAEELGATTSPVGGPFAIADGDRGADVDTVAVGGPAPLAVRGGPAILGGGGVAEGAGVLSTPPFLFTQRFILSS